MNEIFTTTIHCFLFFIQILFEAAEINAENLAWEIVVG